MSNDDSATSANPPETRGRKRLCVIACHVLWRELCHYGSLSPNICDMRFLEQGLHNTPAELRRRVQQEVDSAPPDADAIVFGYGLCSNGIEGVVARDTPIVVVRAHDCITFLLGSRERYREYFDQNPGTYWYSPGWIDTSTQPGKDRFEQTRRHYVETYGEENADYLMQAEQAWMTNYNNAAYVDLGFGASGEYQQYTRECAEWLGWNCDVLEGDAGLVRALLEGDWDEERFLLVPPGHRIALTHDERIVTALEAG
jgi:hypothetical protein